MIQEEKDTETKRQSPNPSLENKLKREERIIQLFKKISGTDGTSDLPYPKGITVDDIHRHFEKRHGKSAYIYAKELVSMADKANDGIVDYEEFRIFVIRQEKALWRLFRKIDLSQDFKLQPQEIAESLQRAGIKVHQEKLSDLIEKMDLDGDGSIDFCEWRDFLLFLPRNLTLANIFQYSEDVTIMSSDGEVSVITGGDLEKSSKIPYFIAGGVAGAVSRTITAPLDRIKVYLQIASSSAQPNGSGSSVKVRLTFLQVIQRLYQEGGIFNFYRGNGLNVLKIVPESATKFYTFEKIKGFLVGDQEKLNLPQRLLAGGLAGITSQTLIYPLDLIKIRRMAVTNSPKGVWQFGADILYTQGIRGLFKGLTPALCGIFPFAAIDLTLFETLKSTYLEKMSVQPSIPVILGCGMASGTVGAISVYPFSLIRTKLQAQGTPQHPKKYDGILHVIRDTYANDSLKGFYKGLAPTLLKVVPALSISYVVYESSKKQLGIQ
ncbi:hypothetical protein DSO57_1009658 [Entomophthora muscae]|uniref:Uncharacterized protein n=1 Tax=Entomophthora muscae TaxID=34485 RepID=A0ACC2SVK2_9FUNG|nr:hypothetical protein DSO57_1009658 [Entomophthora muscae]